jgi:hypothetical protein
MAQWKRAPTMSSMQLEEKVYQHLQVVGLIVNLLCAFNPRMCHSCRVTLKFVFFGMEPRRLTLFARIQRYGWERFRFRFAARTYWLIRNNEESMRWMDIMDLAV